MTTEGLLAILVVRFPIFYYPGLLALFFRRLRQKSTTLLGFNWLLKRIEAMLSNVEIVDRDTILPIFFEKGYDYLSI